MAAAPRMLELCAEGTPRLSLDDENDLRWYFNESEGALGGLRSTFGAAIERLQWGLVAEPFDAADNDAEMVQRLDAHRERRRIHTRLLAVGHRHARTLELVFALEPLLELRYAANDRYRALPIPRYVRERFGRMSFLALSLADEQLPERCKRVAMREGDDVEQLERELVQVERNADASLAAATSAYLAVRTRER